MRYLYIGLILPLLLSGQLWAKPVDSTGSAVIVDNAVDMARYLAIREAIKQAALQSGVQLHSSTRFSNYRVIGESTRIQTNGVINKLQILDEWREEDRLHVRIRAQVDQSSQCSTAKYRKKLAVYPFLISHPTHVSDIMGLENGYSQELARRLTAGGHFLLRTIPQLTLYPEPHRAPDIIDTQIFSQFGQLSDLQFLVSGVIREVSYTPPSPNLLQRFFRIEDRPDSRSLDIELFIHDIHSETLLARHRFNQTIHHDAFVGRDKPFATQSFFKTGTGKAFDKILQQQYLLVQKELACLPFSAHVVNVDKDQVIVNAGNTSWIHVGDKLVVFSRHNTTLEYAGQRLGTPEQPLAVITIKRVQPQFSIGILENPSLATNIKTDDLVRSW
jgi:hypothetical protein